LKTKPIISPFEKGRQRDSLKKFIFNALQKANYVISFTELFEEFLLNILNLFKVDLFLRLDL
jgi:hypothetical protein